LTDGAHLLGQGLVVIPRAIEEKVAIVIYTVPDGNQAVDMQRPLETILVDLGDSDVEDLQGAIGSSVPWDGFECMAHGAKSRCTKQN
jgi:hypothetical protein